MKTSKLLKSSSNKNIANKIDDAIDARVKQIRKNSNFKKLEKGVKNNIINNQIPIRATDEVVDNIGNGARRIKDKLGNKFTINQDGMLEGNGGALSRKTRKNPIESQPSYTLNIGDKYSNPMDNALKSALDEAASSHDLEERILKQGERFDKNKELVQKMRKEELLKKRKSIAANPFKRGEIVSDDLEDRILKQGQKFENNQAIHNKKQREDAAKRMAERLKQQRESIIKPYTAEQEAAAKRVAQNLKENSVYNKDALHKKYAEQKLAERQQMLKEQDKKLSSIGSNKNVSAKNEDPKGNGSNWVYKAAAAGVGGGLVLSIANNKGQQSNSQLYGQG